MAVRTGVFSLNPVSVGAFLRWRGRWFQSRGGAAENKQPNTSMLMLMLHIESRVHEKSFAIWVEEC